MAFEDDERRWFPNLTGEMDEWPSDSEMDDEDTIDNLYDAHMDALFDAHVEFHMSGAPIDVLMTETRERRKHAARAFMRNAFKVMLIANRFEAWLRFCYDQALFKDGGRGALLQWSTSMHAQRSRMREVCGLVVLGWLYSSRAAGRDVRGLKALDSHIPDPCTPRWTTVCLM